MKTDDLLAQTPAVPVGDDFEQQFWGLLRRKYPQNQLVYIPAEMGGDYGIEGYSKDGIAYQCYADQNSLSLRARTDKQKNKLYDDTVKLNTYKKELASILDGMVVSNYFLVVPQYHAAELVTYAHKRAKVVRAFGLPFISADFSIMIKTPEDYPAELQAALHDKKAVALLPPTQVSESSVDAFAGHEPTLVTNLDTKLSQLKSHHAAADSVVLRAKLIRSFLVKEELMESLRSWPETHEAVERQRQLRQESLETESALALDAPQVRLAAVLRDYGEQLLETCGGITASDAQRIAHGQTGEWLMRCPLSFEVAP